MTRSRTLIALGLLAVAMLTIVALRVADSEPVEEAVAAEVPVHVGEIKRATLHRTVTAYGTVEGAPTMSGSSAAGAVVSPFVGGVLAEIEAVEGSHVARGTVLFRLDSRRAEVALQRARQQMEFAEGVLARQQELLAADGTSQRAVQEARQQVDAARSEVAAAETDLAYLTIRAPITGTVVRIERTKLGEFVDANTVLARVVDLGRLVVNAAVPAAEIPGVTVGRPVLVGPSGRAVQGTVTGIGRDIDPATGTYRVLVAVPAAAGLAPGQFTEVRIVVEESPNALVAPVGSVVTRDGEGSWIAVVEGNQAVRRPVTLGLREGGLVEVRGGGIQAGTRIVTDEAYALPEQTRVRIVGG